MDQMFPRHLISICVLRFETAEINGPVSMGDSSIGNSGGPYGGIYNTFWQIVTKLLILEVSNLKNIYRK